MIILILAALIMWLLLAELHLTRKALQEISIASRQQASAYILAGNLGSVPRDALIAELAKQGKPFEAVLTS